jgi:predicted transcriptional regulator YdeE
MSDFQPLRFEDGRPLLLAGLRRRHDFATAPRSVALQWQAFLPLAATLPGRTGNHFYGAMCGADATGVEVLSGVEVSGFEALPPEVGRMRVPALRYAVFAHAGPPATLHQTWQRVLDWLPGSGFESAQQPDFERYRADRDPLAPDAGIEVWVGVVPRPRAP